MIKKNPKIRKSVDNTTTVISVLVIMKYIHMLHRHCNIIYRILLKTEHSKNEYNMIRHELCRLVRSSKSKPHTEDAHFDKLFLSRC
jgi:hypothetical protein